MGDKSSTEPETVEAGSMLEPHVCEVCYQNFNEKTRIPKVLSCGHTYCMRCVKEMFTHGGSILTCPVCRAVTRCKLSKIPTNFQLLLVIKNQKLLCSEEDTAEPGNEESLDPVVNESVDDSIFSALRYFESEVTSMKDHITGLGLNPTHCFPNSAFLTEGGMLPENEPNTLEGILHCVNKVHSAYQGICFLLEKARNQKELITEQMVAGTAKKLPNGGVELSPRRPNGEEVGDFDLLHPPDDEIDDMFGGGPDEEDWDDVDSYSGSNFFADDERMGEQINELFWQHRQPLPAASISFPPTSYPLWMQQESPSSEADHQNLQNGHRMCDVCNCLVPPGLPATVTHNSGRRHLNNLNRQANGLPPEDPPNSRPRGGANRGGQRRRGGRGGGGGAGGSGRGRNGGWNGRPGVTFYPPTANFDDMWAGVSGIPNGELFNLNSLRLYE